MASSKALCLFLAQAWRAMSIARSLWAAWETCRPLPRPLFEVCSYFGAGVASHEHRAVIVGGVGNLQEGRQQLLLADAFEFDAKRVCWVQVSACPFPPAL
jgi:hypothetical protein